MKAERLPQTEAFARRLAALRGQLDADPGTTGDQAVKLLEEYLEALAHSVGYRGEGSLGRYASFLRGRDALTDDLIDRIDLYTQVRNCLAHSYGLQTSPALADELLDFVSLLLKQGGADATQLMTRDVRVVDVGDPLRKARDLMLRGGYGRLPVLDGRAIVGLLTERDVVVAQSEAEHGGPSLSTRTVGDVLPPDAAGRIVTIGPEASRDEVAALLSRPGLVACLVTPGGTADERPAGIITHADLLYRM